MAAQQSLPNQMWAGEQKKPIPKEPPWQEWVAGAIGFALVAGAIGFLLWQALVSREAPPDVTVQVESIQPVSAGYLLSLRAINRGDGTAASLIIEGELQQDNQTVETSSTTIDFLPARSERRGGLFFSRDPRRFRLRLSPKGYQHP
jgi:uncharacterized protein (TIGR02588 family)